MNLSVRLLVLAGALAAAEPLVAQARTADSAHSKTGKAQVIGVVLDSVNGGFLTGATILLDGGAQRNTETDTAGRFSFDTISPGTYQLGVFHPVLDALDISIATKPFHAGPDSTSVVILSVPSPTTIVRGRCGNQKTESGSSAVFGHVTDPETMQPVAGADVSIAWTEIEVSKTFGIRNTPHLVHDTTDKDGAYRFCGLPSSLDATMMARRGAAMTGEIPIALGNRPVEVQARSLLLSKEDSTARKGNASVSGVVVLEGNPAEAVSRVELQGTDIAALTNERGEFTLQNLPSGTRNILARRVGYVAQAVPVDLNPHERQRVTIKLPKFVAMMDPVLVTARRNVALDRVGFNQRKKSAFGYFVDADRISKMHPFYVSDILRTVPGLRVSYSSTGDPIVTSTRDIGGSCVQYWVDDIPFLEITPGEINHFVNGGEVVAAEVYQSGSTPAQYVRAGGSCTTIVLWTRFKIRS
ncbi:MAG TPA: carboxypeptidase regulatory-like domain-containing protein [Gemmatimonadaceae bacterium]